MPKSLHSAQNNVFLDLLKSARIDQGVTQVQLAKALQRQQTDISKVERGVRRLDVVELQAWLTALNYSFPKFSIELDRRIAAISLLSAGSRKRMRVRDT